MCRISPLAATTLAIVIVASLSIANSADYPQWRGPDRDGISKETGLLAEWPKAGPKLLWQVDDLGGGLSTPSVVGGRLYLLTNQGVADEFAEARDVKDGSRIWSTRIGKVGNPDQRPQHAAARSTPTVDGDFIYVLGSDGDLACLEKSKGEIRWQKNLRSDELGGKPGTWAYAESPLVDGDLVISTPGGSKATIVAFEKKDGTVHWKCAIPDGDEAAYASPIVVTVGGVKQYVQLLEKGLVGIEAKTGKLLWRYEKAKSRYRANIPTPLASGDSIYVASAGTGGGSVKLTPGTDGIVPEELYFGSKFPTSIGGSVKIGDFLYGTTGQAMLSIEFATGDIKWQERALGAASMCYADGRLYLYGENGDVALVEPTPEGYREHGRFTPPKQPEHEEGGKAWCHPVVADGRLFLRDRTSLWCYEVADPKARK